MESQALDDRMRISYDLIVRDNNYLRALDGSGGGRGVAKHMTSIPRVASTPEEWLLEPVEQLTRGDDGDTTYRFEIDDGHALLTDLQRAALKWLSSFD
jgi:hypothetical protein